jgi:hypothetical protein
MSSVACTIQPCGSSAPVFTDCGTCASDTDQVSAGTVLRVTVSGTCPTVLAWPADSDVVSILGNAGGPLAGNDFSVQDWTLDLQSAASWLRDFTIGSLQDAFLYITATNATTIGQIRADVQNGFSMVNAAKTLPCNWTVGEIDYIQKAAAGAGAIVDDVAQAIPGTTSITVLIFAVVALAVVGLIWLNKVEGA